MIGESEKKHNGNKWQVVLEDERVRKALQVYQPRKMYRRIFTPLLLIWCMIYQRLNPAHSCDAVVTKLRSGDFDDIDPQTNKAGVSQRMRSESSAAYCKARKRLPLPIMERALEQSARHCQSLPVKLLDWLDRTVYLLDGSTLQIRPYPELVRHYGIHKTAKRLSYWVVIRMVGLFCLQNGVVSQIKEGPCQVSEVALAERCLSFLSAGDLVIGDRGFGMFRVCQAVRHYQGDSLFRLSRGRAFKLFKGQLYPGYDLPVIWFPSKKDTLNPAMSTVPIEGRLIYVRLERKGFRSQDLYLFTTLLDRGIFTRERLIQLYGLRWHVELDLRFVKHALDMYRFESKSVDIFRKELIAGMIAYNMVRLFMILTAQQNHQSVLAYSFTKCLRRVSLFLFRNRLKHLTFTYADLIMLLIHLAKCTLPVRPRSRIEPRWVRPKDKSFPQFWLSRHDARYRFTCRRLSQAVC